MARSRYKSAAKYKKSVDHSNQCNKLRRALEKKYGKKYMKGKDAAHTGKDTAKPVKRENNQGKGRKKQGREKYDSKSSSDVRVKRKVVSTKRKTATANKRRKTKKK